MRQGGQVVSYEKNSKWNLRWKPLNIHTMDCGPNCFSLLKYATWDTSCEMARRTPDGIYTDTILKLLNEAYGDGHKWEHILNYNQYGVNDTIERNNYGELIVDPGHLNHYLYNNEATLALIGSGNLMHYFVVLRQDDRGQDIYHAIDAQSGQQNNLIDYIHQMEEKGFERDTFYIVSSPEIMTDPNQVTMEMVKRYFPRKKKQRQSKKRMNKSRNIPIAHVSRKGATLRKSRKR